MVRAAASTIGATMGGTRRTAERVGELVRATPEAAMHTSKILRTAATSDGVRLGLWPNPGSGIRRTTFTPGQLVNLLLALGCGEPTHAMDTVAAFRSLSTDGKLYRTHTRREKLNALMMMGDGYQEIVTRTTSDNVFLPGPTFGDDLDFMVEMLASPNTTADLRELLKLSTIVITIEPYQSAEIFFHFGDFTDSQRYRMRSQQIELLSLEQEERGASALHRAFYGSAMETLGIIWNDTKAALHKKGPPTNETAASPARDAAAPNQPSAEREQPGRQTPRKVAARERNLNLQRSAFAAGHSTFITERPDVRTLPATPTPE